MPFLEELTKIDKTIKFINVLQYKIFENALLESM